MLETWRIQELLSLRNWKPPSEGSGMQHHSGAEGLEAFWRVAGIVCIGRLKKLESDVHRRWHEKTHPLKQNGTVPIHTSFHPLLLLFHPATSLLDGATHSQDGSSLCWPMCQSALGTLHILRCVGRFLIHSCWYIRVNRHRTHRGVEATGIGKDFLNSIS